tara:strand:+ start:2882 stop:3298 length:417 start_codon:yes stop_codon:yes gene_type:complete
MIKYNLICKCKQTFESWFSTSAEYEVLKRKKLIRCIYCNSTSVEKTVMAPNLSSKSNKINDKIKSERKVKKQLIELRKYIEKNCKNVGDSFPQEARSIYYDKKTSKGIYGKATQEETAELLEEGIDVSLVPWVDKSEN